jgi:DNA-binding NtrC family response regulator
MAVFQRSVLLVDDNQSLRDGLACVLRDEGVETFEASRGDEALALVAHNRIHLAVLDLNLPDMTGVGIYEALARLWPRLPCIFMTAEASKPLVEEAWRLEPLGLLRKPFEVHVFRDLVRRAIAV